MQELQKGQILLIVVLIMVTVLSVSLSVAARSITQTRTSQDSASSEKAFSAAEAGIESFISKTNAGGAVPINKNFATNNSKYNATISDISGTQFDLNNGSPILKDDSIDLWLSDYPTYNNPHSGTFTLFWGQTPVSKCASANPPAALEILVLTGTTANPLLTKYGFDPCPGRNSNNHNNFNSSRITNLGVPNNGNYFRVTLTVNTGLFARIIPLYAPTTVSVIGLGGACGANCSFPGQGTVISSTGTADTTQRKLVTYKFYPRIPTEILQYSLLVPQ